MRCWDRFGQSDSADHIADSPAGIANAPITPPVRPPTVLRSFRRCVPVEPVRPVGPGPLDSDAAGPAGSADPADHTGRSPSPAPAGMANGGATETTAGHCRTRTCRHSRTCNQGQDRSAAVGEQTCGEQLRVNMPWGALERPALGMGLLKAGLAARRAVRGPLLQYALADLIGEERCHQITHELPHIAFVGEWLFTEALYGPDAGRDAQLVEHILHRQWRLSESALTSCGIFARRSNPTSPKRSDAARLGCRRPDGLHVDLRAERRLVDAGAAT